MRARTLLATACLLTACVVEEQAPPPDPGDLDHGTLDGALDAHRRDAVPRPDRGAPPDLAPPAPDAVPDARLPPSRCERACATAAECLAEPCAGSVLADYGACVDACDRGALPWSILRGAECADVLDRVCANPLGDACACPPSPCLENCGHLVDCMAEVCDGPVTDCAAQCAQAPEAFESAPPLTQRACGELVDAVCPQVADRCGGCPPPPGAANTIGAPCASADDCVAEGLTPTCLGTNDPPLTALAFPGGYCSGRDCGAVLTCGPGAVCVQTQGGDTLCVASCEGDGDCREGYPCQDIGAPVCLPPRPEGP